MDGARTRVRAGLAVLTVAALLGATACGDDDDDAASGAAGGDASDEAGAPSGGVGKGDADDPCDLLGVAELEAQFSAQGTVHEGQSHEPGPGGLDGVSCNWEIGDTSDGFSRVNLSIVGDSNESGAEFLATRREAADDPVEVPSLGEGAFLEFNGVYFLADDVAVQLSALLPDLDLDGLQGKLVALAELVRGRL